MKKIICIIIMITSMFFSGCVEKKVSVSTEKNNKDYVTYNMGKAPDNLIMLENSTLREQDLLANLFEGLVKSDDKGKIVPALAEKWVVSQDEATYKFKIRDNAKWSDGSEINAEDFVNFFAAVLSKNIKNVYASQLFCIYGAEDYHNGKCDFNNVAISAIDKKNLQIKLNYPCNYFLSVLSEPAYSIRNIDDNLIQWKKQYKRILYSGSFIIDDFSNKNEITFKKNNDYWDEKSVKSNKIMVSCIESSEASMAAFDNNKIDIFEGPPIFEINNLIKSNKIQDFSSFKYGTLVFNLRKENSALDLNLRKSLAICIDREYISKEILNDVGKAATSYVPNNISDGMNGTYLNKNFFKNTIEKEKALELLGKSKFNKEKDCLKLIYEDSVQNRKVCDNISKKIKENLNIRVECEGYVSEQFYEEIKKDGYQIAKVDFCGEYDYPLAFLDKYSNETSVYGYRNSQLDNCIAKCKIDKDKAKKMDALRTSENILAEDIPFIPLYFNKTIICRKSNVVGVYCTKKGNIKLDKVYIK